MSEQFVKFECLSPINIMESAHGVALLKGTLLVEGISRNKNKYELDEMENIAKQAVGVPMYYGVKEGINPNTGMPAKNLHDDSDDHRVGRIIKTMLDKVARKVYFIAEVANTPLFPDLVDKIKTGWGVSVGGFVTKFNPVVDTIKGLCNKIKDMIVEHVTLISPQIVRGQDEAQVESVSVQETVAIQETVVYEDDNLPKQPLTIRIITKWR